MNARQRRKARRARERRWAVSQAWAAEVCKRLEGKPILTIKGDIPQADIDRFREEWYRMIDTVGAR